MNTDSYKADFSDRLKKVLDGVAGGSVEAKAKELGTTATSVYSYLNGKTLPPVAFLIALREKTNINLDWLLTGEGEATRVSLEHINQKYILIIYIKLNKYLKACGSLIEKKGINITPLHRIMYAAQIYNFLMDESKKYTKHELEKNIDRILRLIFGVNVITYKVESDDLEDFADMEEIEFAQDGDIPLDDSDNPEPL